MTTPHEFTLALCCLLYVISQFGIASKGGEPHNKIDSRNAEWVYIVGGDVKGSSGNQQVLPGSRSRAAGWGDEDGNFWMFGGIGHDSSDSKIAHITNDLWMFNLSSMTWNIIQEPRLNERNGHTQPSPRRGAVACGVDGIIIAVFGGEGLDAKMLNDTWIYDIDRKSWFSIPHKNNVNDPPGRVSPVVWCRQNFIIIYGGKQGEKLLDDMWQFSLTNLSWVKLSFSAEVNPSSRIGSMTWAHDDDLWLFGGATTSASSPVQLRSDLWKFSLTTKQWTLLSEGRVLDDTKTSVISERSQASSGPEPSKFSQGWCNKKGSLLYMYGGEGHNRYSISNEQSHLFKTLWEYNITKQKWKQIPFFTARMRSSRSITHVPGRSRGNSWSGLQGEFYTFGGLAHNTLGQVSQTNDIWSLIPPSTPIPEQFKESSLEIVQFPTGLKKNGMRPGFIFLMVLLSFCGVVMLVGAVFCMKKMTDYPRHHPTDKFRVRYSKLNIDGEPHDDAEEFLLHNDDDELEEVRSSFRIAK